MNDNFSDKYIDIYDHYVHSLEPRREFLKKLAKVAGGTAATAALLPWLEGTGAEAAMVAPGDGRLTTAMESFAGTGQGMKAYVVRPKGSGKLPAVVVIHENRGLHAPHPGRRPPHGARRVPRGGAGYDGADRRHAERP